jgi:hypothetical protein
MANKLAIVVLAAAFAASILPAYAAGMPDTGTKNFIPGGDTPSYLTNENLAVAPGSAAQPMPAAADDQAEAPTRSGPVSIHATQTATRRHDRHAAGHKSGHRAAVSGNTKTRSARGASTKRVGASKSASLRRSARPPRASGKTESTAQTGPAKHGKANAWHAAAKSSAKKG